VALMDGVLATDHPTNTLTWFANPQVPALLTSLARGTIPIWRASHVPDRDL
jgi:hypothetical protein